MKHSISCNLKRCDGWVRLLYMVVIFVCYSISKMIVAAIAVFQIVMFVFTRNINPSLCVFGQNLSTYHYQVIRFLTFNTETRPFPFSDWPHGVADTNGEDDSTPSDAHGCGQHCSCQCKTDNSPMNKAQDTITKPSPMKENIPDAKTTDPVLDATVVDDTIKPASSSDNQADVPTAPEPHKVSDLPSSTNDDVQKETTEDNVSTVLDVPLKKKKDDKDSTVS